MAQHGSRLRLEVLAQPDDTTCGPTCLHAVYRYWGDEIPLDEVIAGVRPLPGGGTLAVWLAHHALRRGYDAEILTYNLQLFDPTWFRPGVDLAERLRAQARYKRGPKLSLSTDAYLEFLELGGTVRHEELTASLVTDALDRGVPVLTGLSATYLYGCAREHRDREDDLRGRATGHFVVVGGHDRGTSDVHVADPLHDNPLSGSGSYRVSAERLIGAVLLGVLTYDANLLLITPRERP